MGENIMKEDKAANVTLQELVDVAKIKLYENLKGNKESFNRQDLPSLIGALETLYSLKDAYQI